MNTPSYPAARAVAERIRERLDQTDRSDKPEVGAIEDVIDAAFWASLRREEGKSPKISLILAPPEQLDSPLRFETSLELTPDVLARLGPAVERPGIHLGVWWYGGRLGIWGTTRSVPAWCFVLEVVAPGLLVVKYRRSDPSTKFVNDAVLDGAEVKFIEAPAVLAVDEVHASRPLLAFYASAGHIESDNVLVRLAISMRAHGRGGSLLVVPEGSEHWRQSIVQPITYSVVPAYSYDATSSDGSQRVAIEALAGATAVDGATVITDQLSLRAFGVKIVPRDGEPRVERVFQREPVQEKAGTIVEPTQLGGTRHLSAAQFAQDQRDSFAMVASQDGRFTLFGWSSSRAIVQAHRLESLLI